MAAVDAVDTVLGPLFVDDRGEQDQPAALLWPSLFCDHSMWRHQIDALLGGGRRTLALDPPGHGRSPGPGRRFTMDECAQAVLQVLDAVGVHAPVLYLGTSWGGFIAPMLALRAPERISAMVLFNTSAERPTSFERRRAALLAKLLAIGPLDDLTGRMIVSGLLAPETRSGQPEIGAGLVQRMHSWDRRAFITTVRSVLVDRQMSLDVLADVKVPTLVLSGEQDRTLPSIHSARIAAHLPGARHVQVAGAAHLVALERPHEANSLILEFAGALPRP
jgi:3-oxoadipate enol-lactonase